MAFIKGKLFIIAAPSGAGKTTLVNELLHRIGTIRNIERVVTYTSRPPRPTETDGKDYHFLPPREFALKKEAGFFMETTTYDHHFYGSPASVITELAKGKSFLLTTDRTGAKIIKDLVPQAVLIWITVPDINVLADRMVNRKAQDEQKIKDRLALAQHEIEQEEKEPFFEYHILNDVFEEAVKQFIDIVNGELSADL